MRSSCAATMRPNKTHSTSRRPSRLGAERSAPRRQNRRRRQRGASSGHGGLPLALVFVVLVGINIYVFFFRGGTSIQDLMKASAITQARRGVERPTNAPRQRARAARPEAVPVVRPLARDGVRSVRGSMRGRSGLLVALQAYGVRRGEAARLIEALRPALDLRSLQPEHEFEITFTPGRDVTSFRYFRSASRVIALQRTAAGGFVLGAR